MEPLNLEMFVNNSEDREISEYRILEYLKHCGEKFNSNRLYPELAELRVLTSRLETLVEQKTYLNKYQPLKVKSTIIKGKYISLESENEENTRSIEDCMDLIEWTLPKFHSIIEEGLIIYNFVFENISIEPVGKMPDYQDEGYLIIPDNKKFAFMFNQYECSMGYDALKPIRAVKTNLIKTSPLEPANQTPGKLIEEIASCPDLMPNPAVFVCRTDLDFDYEHTLLPVAKKKLVFLIT